jgi:hypothetical protein
MNLNRFREATAAAQEAQNHYVLYKLAFLQNDKVGMDQQIAWSKANAESGDEHEWVNVEADTAAYFGSLAKARELSRQAVWLAEARGERLCSRIRIQRSLSGSALWELGGAIFCYEGEPKSCTRASPRCKLRHRRPGLLPHFADPIADGAKL